MTVAGLWLLTLVIPGRSREGTLARAERVYLFSTALPMLLAIVFPGLASLAITDRGGSLETQRWWSDRLLLAGLIASGALVVAGAALVWRRWWKDGVIDGRLLNGMVMASVPLLLVTTVRLLYWSFR